MSLADWTPAERVEKPLVRALPDVGFEAERDFENEGGSVRHR